VAAKVLAVLENVPLWVVGPTQAPAFDVIVRTLLLHPRVFIAMLLQKGLNRATKPAALGRGS